MFLSEIIKVNINLHHTVLPYSRLQNNGKQIVSIESPIGRQVKVSD